MISLGRHLGAVALTKGERVCDTGFAGALLEVNLSFRCRNE